MSEATTAITISAFGIAVSSLIGALAYFAKKKLESIEGDIEELDEKIDRMEKKTSMEHKVSVEWMSGITDALVRNNMEVDKPDEISETIDVNEPEE